MLFPSLGGYMLKTTKDIIFKYFFFSPIPMGAIGIVVRSGWFRTKYYLQKI